MNHLQRALARSQRLISVFSPALQAIALLALRLWLAAVFFKSGLTKIDDWDTTILLFSSEYTVPLLPPEAAAILATLGELLLPVMLVAGLAGRVAAIGLFILNAVAVISYPALAGSALDFHYQWGLMLLVLVAFGMGRLSLDGLIMRRYGR